MCFYIFMFFLCCVYVCVFLLCCFSFFKWIFLLLPCANKDMMMIGIEIRRAMKLLVQVSASFNDLISQKVSMMLILWNLVIVLLDISLHARTTAAEGECCGDGSLGRGIKSRQRCVVSWHSEPDLVLWRSQEKYEGGIKIWVFMTFYFHMNCLPHGCFFFCMAVTLYLRVRRTWWDGVKEEVKCFGLFWEDA